jgi:hypothetical protein
VTAVEVARKEIPAEQLSQETHYFTRPAAGVALVTGASDSQSEEDPDDEAHGAGCDSRSQPRLRRSGGRCLTRLDGSLRRLGARLRRGLRRLGAGLRGRLHRLLALQVLDVLSKVILPSAA